MLRNSVTRLLSRPRTLLASLLVTLAACGAMQTATDLLIPRTTDVELGTQLNQDIRGQIVVHPDAEAQQWLAQLGQRMLQSTPGVPPEYRFSFTLVDDDTTLNAFALPGGPIYMYSGLIMAAESEAEVAGVLAHEIGHVIHRHGAQQLIAALGLEAVLALALGENPSALAQLTSQLGATGALLAYGRDHELDADAIGLNVLIRAGYDPHPFIGFFEKLDSSRNPPEFLSTHPDPGNRVRRLRQSIATRTDLPTHRGDAAAFDALKARL